MANNIEFNTEFNINENKTVMDIFTVFNSRCYISATYFHNALAGLIKMYSTDTICTYENFNVWKLQRVCVLLIIDFADHVQKMIDYM